MYNIDRIINKGINKGAFPGAVFLVSTGDDLKYYNAYGYSEIFSKKKVKSDTVFDLASLTKPLATTLAVMLLIKQQKLLLNTNIKDLLPCFNNTDKAYLTVRNLLCHNSGLFDYKPYYKILSNISFEKRNQTLKNLLVETPLAYFTGTKTVYSDLGFMILRMVVEKVSKKRFDLFVVDEIYKPLGIKDLFFIDIKKKINRDFAATEICPWRNKMLSGAVHDDNAYAIGGVDGHAGLFGTAFAVYSLLVVLLKLYHREKSITLFTPDLVRKFFKKQADSERALGFDIPSLKKSSCGHFFSKETIGHLGFTGTSFWVDLNRRIIIVFLTNRVHPFRGNNKLKRFRPVLHDAVMKNLLVE